MADTNFKFYKRVTDDPAFGELLRGWLFECAKGTRKAGKSATPTDVGPTPYDAVAALIGSVEGGDAGRSTRGVRQIAAELKKRRAERSWYR